MMDTQTLRGVRVTVLNTRPDIETSRVFERLDGALGLIERYQPHRLRRFRRDVRGIIVKRFACRAAFFGDTRECLIELTFADEDIRVVAVGDGDQAIAALDRNPPDIVLADVGMPGRTPGVRSEGGAVVSQGRARARSGGAGRRSRCRTRALHADARRRGRRA